MKKSAKNCHIDPVLYDVYLQLKNTLGAMMVHRRTRKSTTCIEIVLCNDAIKYYHNRINTLKEAEACGFWVICRRQRKRGHETWHGRTVYQLFLTPVHPKKRHEKLLAAQVAADEMSFEPITTRSRRSCRTTSSPFARNLQNCNLKFAYMQNFLYLCARFEKS